LGEITNKNITHFGIGLAESKDEVKVVEMLTIKHLTVNTMGQSEDGGVEIRGMILNLNVGLYAARIISRHNAKKDFALVGPTGIKIDKATGQYIIQFKGPLDNVFYNQEDPKIVEIYVRTA
jgi:hypothetical protein